jgi:hypothetical protein
LATVSINSIVENVIQTAQSINQGVSRMRQATCSVSDMFSWIGQLSEKMLESVAGSVRQTQVLQQRLCQLNFITAQNYILPQCWQWANGSEAIDGVPDTLRAMMQALPRQLVHCVTLVADAYPEVAQQVSVSVTFGDDFGRPLQIPTQVPAGEVSVRQNDGELAVKSQNKLTHAGQ